MCAPRARRSPDAWHSEGELIKGAGNRSAVGGLVERTTRLVPLCKMVDATAESVLAAFSAKLNSIAAPDADLYAPLVVAAWGSLLVRLPSWAKILHLGIFTSKTSTDDPGGMLAASD